MKTATSGENRRHKAQIAMRFKYIAFLLAAYVLVACDANLNSNNDPHFDNEGHLLLDTTDNPTMELQQPSRIKFYVEVSGSMNGFFRPNIGTDFKTDVWQIMSYYSAIAQDVAILTNGGSIGERLSLNVYRQKMNTGAFVSSASTKVPIMLQSIIEDLNTDENEVAILISDMKYSPVGASAPDVLLKQYSIDVSKLFAEYGKAVALICATSSFADKKGNIVCEASPYYYIVIGNPAQVAEMRNGISILLQDKDHFIDNIETGMNYGKTCYSFGVPLNCWQLDNVNPTFCGFDPSSNDTCTIRLKIHLENYRWLIADKYIIAQCLNAKCLYGSEVYIGDIAIDINNKDQRQIKRSAVATVELKLTNMATESDVIEWQLNIPDSDISLFAPYIENVLDENDITKSYSVFDFIQGMFHGGVLNSILKPNYILVSQNS